jgi:hypothetical protein
MFTDEAPQTLPFEGPNCKPDGSCGLISHETTAPPATVGERVGMLKLRVSVRLLDEYEIMAISAFTVMFTVVVTVPPVLVAEIV